MKRHRFPLFEKMLKDSREAMKITQEDLARRLGITVSTLQKWEQGANIPDAPKIIRLLEWFGRDGAWVLYALGLEPSTMRALCEGFMDASRQRPAKARKRRS